MKWLRLPATWGAVAGIVIGFFGLPLPKFWLTNWVWIHPTGFRVSSILIFAALAFIIASGIQKLLKIDMGQKASIWAIGISSFALLIGIVGVYRLEGDNQSTMGRLGYLGVIDTMGASAHLSKDPVSSSGVKVQGAVLLKAGADLGAYGMLAQRYGIQSSQISQINTVASALNEAGVNLESPRNREQALTAKKFVVEAGNIIGNYQKSHTKPGQNFTWTHDKILAVIRKIASIRPSQYTRSEPFN